MKAALGIVVAVVAGAVVWYLASPLFIDRVVDEPLPFERAAPAEAPPSRSQIAAMSGPERAAAEKQIVQGLAGAAKSMMAEPMPPTAEQPVLIARGRFGEVDALHKGSGDALLYRLADGSHLVRFENFEVANGPDLYVYLVEHRNPTGSADVKDGYLDLGRLRGNAGNQNYPVPAGTPVEGYGSVVIWCKLFGVLFSPAPLQEPS
jgi:hypothetical protein